jgi:hypothetical protein
MLHSLPFKTFGEIAALGLQAKIYCPGCHKHRPIDLLPVGGEDPLAFLSCGTCLPPWEINYVPIDRPPWSVVKRERDDRFKCPGCQRAVAWRIHGPTWRPIYCRYE